MSSSVVDRVRPGLPVWLPVLLPLVTLLALYRDTAASMVSIWARSETFMHAFLVPPIVLWLIWRCRAASVVQPPSPAAWVLLPIAGVALVWLLGELAAVNVLTQAALVGLIVLTVPAVLGLELTCRLMFPLAFLFFCVPVGEFLVPTLMTLTAEFTVAALWLSGIPVYREGLQFVIPSGAWSVEPACSGIRYLMASLMTGVLFAYLNYRSLHRRLIFVCVSILLPLLANWVRAYLIVLVGHLSSNEIAAGADHLVYGWVFFGVVILLMFMVGVRWAEPVVVAPSPTLTSGDALSRHHSNAPSWRMAGIVAALMLLPPGISWSLERMERRGTTPQLGGLAAALGDDWRPSTAPLHGWKPDFQNPSADCEFRAASEGGQVAVYVGYYHRQDRERKLVSSENRLVRSGDARWRQVASGYRTLQLGDSMIEVRAAKLSRQTLVGQSPGSSLAVWQLYWVNGSLTANDAWAKAVGAFHRLLGRGDDAAVIVISAPQQDDGREEAVLEAFLRDNLHRLDASLRGVRTARNMSVPSRAEL